LESKFAGGISEKRESTNKQISDWDRRECLMKIERFEDLLAWQEAGVLTREIYAVGTRSPLNRDFSLRDQIQRAAVSAMSNPARGFERIGRREKIHFMNIARASCAEVKSLLYVCLDNHHLDATTVEGFQARCTRISRLVSGLIRSVSNGSRPDSDSDSDSTSTSSQSL
jgi:four helix bundle protein